jgi:hypothetical protein
VPGEGGFDDEDGEGAVSSVRSVLC